LGKTTPGDLDNPPMILLSNLLKENWDQIFFELPQIRLKNILWDQWYSGDNDVTIRFNERVTTVFSDEERKDISVICDPYGTTTHFKFNVTIHLFVRDFNMTNQTDNIPIETDYMLRIIDDWIARHPRILADQGISTMKVNDADSSLPFDNDQVTRSQITVQMTCTKMYL
jgi:hypothetical protein